MLISILKANMGQALTPEIAADILVAADQVSTLVPLNAISKIQPEQYNEFTLAVERIEDITEEIKPLHQSHWDETEAHRHGLPFNPDYETFIRYEQAGRYILFTLRKEGELLGNCAMYLDQSTHTRTLIATEDTLYLLPQARKNGTAKRFVAYIERGLKSIGTAEINITVKTVNRAGLFFQRLGYKHVENGLTKILED
ncbi:MAG TPA: GNAT family N-acetyltransferase [Nitrosospira sp.]|nr:GNAT family N-acetyltransferase [Nitrosospira sp.]